MRTLGEKIGESRNVIYPDIGMLDSMQSLDTIAEKIAQYIQNLHRTGEQKYIIIGHSLGGVLAILVAQKLKVGHIIQLSTPNATPPVAKLS